MVTNQSEHITDAHIDNVMPNIAKVYWFYVYYTLKKFYLKFLFNPQRTDDAQSMVRKAAVFCIVRFYIVLGEDRVKPKFSLLNSSKIR